MKNRERTNKILQSIANVLYINRHKIGSRGLLNGRMGVAIYLYHYARYSGHNEYEEFADDFIDNVINNKNGEVRHSNFTGGISGLAWGFNYLIENKFVEIEDDTILDDLEVFLLKNISTKTTVKKFDHIDLFGIAMYYTSKIKRNLVDEKDLFVIDVLIKKCRNVIGEDKSNPVFDINFFNFLLYFLTEVAGNFRIKRKTISALLTTISDILLKQKDYSIYSDEDIYILRKNIEHVKVLTSKKDKWIQIQLKLSSKTLSELSCFSWKTFVYFSYSNIKMDDFLLDEIDVFIEQKLDNLLDTDFILNGKLLNIGIGLLRNHSANDYIQNL